LLDLYISQKLIFMTLSLSMYPISMVTTWRKTKKNYSLEDFAQTQSHTRLKIIFRDMTIAANVRQICNICCIICTHSWHLSYLLRQFSVGIPNNVSQVGLKPKMLGYQKLFIILTKFSYNKLHFANDQYYRLCCFGLVKMSKNPVMTFPKRMNTFIDEREEALNTKIGAKLSG